MELKIYTDGGALGNPGPAASAFVIFKGTDLIAQEAKFLGHGTNNQAEYRAVILALEELKQIISGGLIGGPARLLFYSDSNLLVNQLNGLYKVKNSDIRGFIAQIRILEQELNIPIVYTYVPREKNLLADSLVKKALGR